MKTNAINGLAYHFCPKYTSDTTFAETINDATNTIVATCEVHFFKQNSLYSNQLPDTGTLYNYNSVAEVLDAYSEDLAFSMLNVDFSFKYDKDNNRRIIKKDPVDALEFESNVDGTLEWAVIKITADDAVSGDALIFTDGITGWAEDNTTILVDTKDLVSGDGSVTTVKDITITIRDNFTEKTL